jgi:hypothetical protein
VCRPAFRRTTSAIPPFKHGAKWISSGRRRSAARQRRDTGLRAASSGVQPVQLRKHGEAVLGPSDDPEPLRSIALWSDVNVRAADYGERMGERYLRLRFEDVCSDPGAEVAKVLRFFGLEGDVDAIGAEVVEAPPTLGRWRDADPELQTRLTERAADALTRFGYQSSSE